MNHTSFPKEDHLPDWARRDNKDTKGDRVDHHHIWMPVLNAYDITRVYAVKHIQTFPSFYVRH